MRAVFDLEKVCEEAVCGECRADYSLETERQSVCGDFDRELDSGGPTSNSLP